MERGREESRKFNIKSNAHFSSYLYTRARTVLSRISYYRASLIIAHLFYPLCFVNLEKRRLKTFWKKSKIGRTGKDRIRRHTLAHV